MHQSALAPDPDAEQLADEMLGATDTLRAVLEETITSAEQGRATEAGRTACGAAADTRAPLARFPRAIELQSCPVDRTGIWHTHPANGGLAAPEHSLPDWANVALEGVDASVVVGTESSEVVVAAADREAMAAAFRDALGLDARATRAVERARGQAIPDPGAARQRVRDRLSPLVRRERTAFPGLADRARTAGVADAGAVVATHRTTRPDRPGMALHRAADRCSLSAAQPGGVDIVEVAIGSALGTVVGTFTERLVFGGGP